MVEKTSKPSAKNPSIVYHNITVGYMGGKVRAGASQAVIGLCPPEGSEVDFKGRVLERFGEMAVEIDQIAAAGELIKRAA